MEITRLYMDNDLCNFCHLIACEETGEATVLDPLDAPKCLAEADRQGLTITKIVNTHEHFDHIQGNPEVVAATGAKIHAHMTAMATIPNASVPLFAGQTVEVGTSVRLRVLHTPGHTQAHVCLASEIGAPSLFRGDTFSMPGPETASLAATRTTCTAPLSSSLPFCRTRPASTQATTTSSTT